MVGRKLILDVGRMQVMWVQRNQQRSKMTSFYFRWTRRVDILMDEYKESKSSGESKFSFKVCGTYEIVT